MSLLGSSTPALPVSHSSGEHVQQEGQVQGGLRRRLSSLSLKMQASSAWSLPRSNSLSAMGDHAGASLRQWWLWGSAWLLSTKPFFAADLEMNEQESKVLGSHHRGTWRHLLLKLRSEFRRLLRSDSMTLPQTYTSSNTFRRADHL